MEFEQDEPPYFPGEEGNDPFERSKFALAHIWHEVSPRIYLRKYELCRLLKHLRKRRKHASEAGFLSSSASPSLTSLARLAVSPPLKSCL